MKTMEAYEQKFPFLLGGAFIEAQAQSNLPHKGHAFPFLLGGAFIEAVVRRRWSL